MIQRIQTVYLFFIAVLMVGMAFLPVMEVSNNEQVRSLTLFSFGMYAFSMGVSLPALSIGIGALAFLNIFFYKKRKLQINICCWMLALILSVYGLVFYAYSMLGETAKINAIISPSIAIVFPLAALFLDGMAIMSIRKDDRLVNSFGRLRG